MSTRLCRPLVDEVPTQRPAGGVEMPRGRWGALARPAWYPHLWRARGVMGPGRAPGLPPGKGPTSVAAPQGELPLSAIHINLEEKEKQIRSFLIEGGLCPGLGGRCPRLPLCPGPGDAHGVCVPGPLINTIRVLCASYEDYSHWLLCLQTVSRREGAPLLPGPEGFPGLRGPLQVRVSRPWWAVMERRADRGSVVGRVLPHGSLPPTHCQVLGSGRGSLSSDGQTSWDSGYPAPHSNRTSRSLPECSVPSAAGCPAQPASVSVWGYGQGHEVSLW